MKKKLLLVLFTSLVMLLAFGGISYVMYEKAKVVKEEEKKAAEQELDIFLEDSKKEVYDAREITPITNLEKSVSAKTAYTTTYTEGKKQEIAKYKKKNLYDFESPLWMWDAFGTNHLSMYLYFKSTQPAYIKYSIQVQDDSVPNFTRTLYNGEKDNLTREHEYQLVGFIPGKQNLVILQMYDEKDQLLNKKVYSLYVPNLSSKADLKISVSKGRSEEQVSNGLYPVFGEKYIWFYDNSGILRSEIPIEGRTSQRIFMEDGSMIYGLDVHRFVKVDGLGRVENIYSIGKYFQYSDFAYNGYGDLWILASKPGQKDKSIHDTVIALNLETKTVKELFSMDDFIPEMKKKAKKPKKDKYFNWVDLNSITQVKSDEMLVSSRELSTIFKIVNVNSRSPRLSYMIGEEKIWKGLTYAKRLLIKSGQAEADEKQAEKQAESVLDLGEAKEVFLSQFGQTWIQTGQSSELEDGQYYVYVWDSNFGYSPTRKKFKWDTFAKIGTIQKDARRSYIKKYLVDENTATYQIEDTQEVTYTRTKGSTQFYGENRIDNYGNQRSFAEYDSQGRMIRKFSHNQNGVLRVEKMDMKKFWFY